MGIISGSVSFRDQLGDHFRVGDHFGVGIISGAVQVMPIQAVVITFCEVEESYFLVSTAIQLSLGQDVP